jgi:hypothetical protein
VCVCVFSLKALLWEKLFPRFLCGKLCEKGMCNVVVWEFVAVVVVAPSLYHLFFLPCDKSEDYQLNGCTKEARKEWRKKLLKLKICQLEKCAVP